jgi:hypothetical protein
VAEPIFHVITEDPEIEHVAAQVQPAAMHEHGRKDRDEIGARVCGKTPWHDRPSFYKRVAAT